MTEIEYKSNNLHRTYTTMKYINSCRGLCAFILIFFDIIPKSLVRNIIEYSDISEAPIHDTSIIEITIQITKTWIWTKLLRSSADYVELKCRGYWRILIGEKIVECARIIFRRIKTFLRELFCTKIIIVFLGNSLVGMLD